jgi:hypothetical protein
MMKSRKKPIDREQLEDLLQTWSHIAASFRAAESEEAAKVAASPISSFMRDHHRANERAHASVAHGFTACVKDLRALLEPQEEPEQNAHASLELVNQALAAMRTPPRPPVRVGLPQALAEPEEWAQRGGERLQSGPATTPD